MDSRPLELTLAAVSSSCRLRPSRLVVIVHLLRSSLGPTAGNAPSPDRMDGHVAGTMTYPHARHATTEALAMCSLGSSPSSSDHIAFSIPRVRAQARTRVAATRRPAA